MIYDFIYQHIFPNYDATGKNAQLIALFFAQIIVWIIAILIANQVLV